MRSLALVLGALALAGCLGSSEQLLAPAPGLGLPGPDLEVAEVRFEDYHDSAALDAELQRVAAEHPDLVTLVEVGKSVQGKPLLLAKVTAPGAPGKPVAFMDGCHHGNENQGCEAPLFVARFLAENYARNATVRWILDRFEVHLLPDVNPDGHDAQTRVNANGVNLNRNYPTDHGDPLGLSYPLGEPVTPSTWDLPAPGVPADVPFNRPVRPSENGGFQALDQPEAAAVASHMAQLKQAGTFASYLTFHTAAQSLIIPWGAFRPPRDIPAEHEEVLQALAGWATEHTFYVGGRNSWFDGSTNLGYSASGTSQDWAYDCCDVPSATFETFSNDAASREAHPDINYWGASVMPIVLKWLVNTDRLQAWEAPEREFPYPPAWEGVHYWSADAPRDVPTAPAEL